MQLNSHFAPRYSSVKSHLGLFEYALETTPDGTETGRILAQSERYPLGTGECSEDVLFGEVTVTDPVSHILLLPIGSHIALGETPEIESPSGTQYPHCLAHRTREFLLREMLENVDCNHGIER